MSANSLLLEATARRLRPLLDEVVFVGGQVTELLLTDPAASRVRYTRDVDAICRAFSRSQYDRIGAELRRLGFSEDRSEGAPVCRWRAEDSILDLMPLDETVLGFGSRWYERAYDTATSHPLAPGIEIRIVRAPLFLATKWSAFEGRGEGDYLGSHDVEDIITLVAGRPELPDEVAAEPADLREWITACTTRFLRSGEAPYAIAGALPDARFDPRLPGRVEDALRRMLHLG